MTTRGGKRSNAGRTKTSTAWTGGFFEIAPDGDTQCKVTNAAGEQCSYKKKEKYPTNLVYHLATSHKADGSGAYERYINLEKTKQQSTPNKEPSSGTVDVLASLRGAGSKYDISKPADKAKKDILDRSFAVWILSKPHQPLNTGEDEFFRFFAKNMNSRWEPLKRTRTGQIGDKFFEQFLTKLRTTVGSCQSLTASVDLWSARDGKPYMGIVCQGPLPGSYTLTSRPVALRPAPYPHTAARIAQLFKEIWADCGFTHSQLFKVLTDNGSNVVRCFNIELGRLVAAERQTALTVDNVEAVGESEAIDEFGLEEEFDEEAYDRELLAAREAAQNKYDQEFEQIEAACMKEFGEKRLSCFVHSLQLVVMKFSLVPTFDALLKRAYQLVSKVHGRKPGEELKKTTGKSLVRHMPVRWSSTFMLINRMLDVKDALIPVLFNHKIDNLTHAEWELLEEMRDLLVPFAEYTEVLQSSKMSTISTLIPALVVLENHLKGSLLENARHADVQSLADFLLLHLKARFDYVTDTENDNFVPIYCAATHLDPRYRSLLDTEQEKKAIEYIKAQFASEQCNTEVNDNVEEEQPKAKSSRVTSNILSQLLKQKRSEQQNTLRLPSPTLALSQLQAYNGSGDDLAESANVLQYWSTIGQEKYDSLAKYALSLLSVPASTASAERLFSAAGKSKSGDRIRLCPKSLECEVLVNSNRDLVMELLNNT